MCLRLLLMTQGRVFLPQAHQLSESARVVGMASSSTQSSSADPSRELELEVASAKSQLRAAQLAKAELEAELAQRRLYVHGCLW